jgi:hypothetical protein
VSDQALDQVIDRGFSHRYGARALKREVENSIVLPLALALLERPVERGQILRVVSGSAGALRVELAGGEEGAVKRRAPKAEPARPVAARGSLVAAAQATCERVATIAKQADQSGLEVEQARLTELRSEPEFWRHPLDSARALYDLELVASMLRRLTRLGELSEGLLRDAESAGGRPRQEEVGRHLEQFEATLADAELELVHLGRAGAVDALVEVRPLGARGRSARDLLVRTYGDWTSSRGGLIEFLHDPLEDDEPVWMGITVPYAAGLLRLEAGLHKLQVEARPEISASAARVVVVPWDSHLESQPLVGKVTALKRLGAYGGKVRSRWESTEGLVLQNGRTIAENAEFAPRVAGAWGRRPPPVDSIVRRYDLEKPLVRDVLTDTSSGHPKALGAERFDRLLRRRVLADRESAG